MINDRTIQNLLDLDGIKYVIDYELKLWVKFEAKRVKKTQFRPQGIKYSLSLHDQFNDRLMGFDNAHSIECVEKQMASPIRVVDHWHQNYKDSGKPYYYVNAEKLLIDFWVEVNNIVNRLKVN